MRIPMKPKVVSHSDRPTLLGTSPVRTESAQVPHGAARAGRLNWLAWIGIVLLFLAQWGLFRQFALREVVWAYPTYFDQCAYLEQSYQTYERILDHGLVHGLAEGMGLTRAALPLNAAGATLHPQAALLYLVVGPSRLSAISLNFFYWALFQLVLVGTIRWLAGRWSVAFLGLGLLLTTISGFRDGGGLFDFRLDFMAMCLFGIFLCAVIRSGVFADWRWSLIAGLAAAVLGAFRFITLAYMLGIFGSFFLFLLAQWAWRWHDLHGQPGVHKRIRGLVLSGVVVAALTGPVLWHHRDAINSYYVAGHLKSNEKNLRAEEVGTTTLGASLRFYPHYFLEEHVGYGFPKLVGLVVVAGLIVALVRASRGSRTRVAEGDRLELIVALTFMTLGILVPLAVLTADTAKAPQVAGIMVPPLVWLVLLSALTLFAAFREDSISPLSRRALFGMALVAMLAGIYTQFRGYCRHTYLTVYRPEVQRLVTMYDHMTQECQELGWQSPAIANDCIVDWLHHKNLTILAYERHAILFSAGQSLGALDAYPIPELYERLRLSDFAILTRPTGAIQGFQFPFDRQMDQLRPDVLKFCRANMVELEQFHCLDRNVTLFIRPAVKMQAAADGWITSDGMTVTGLAEVLRVWPVIEMRGEANFQYLGRVPGVTAYLPLPDRQRQPVQVQITAAGTHYVIHLRLSPADLPTTGPVSIHVGFDAHFIPRDIGANADTRELVMPLPAEARLAHSEAPNSESGVEATTQSVR